MATNKRFEIANRRIGLAVALASTALLTAVLAPLRHQVGLLNEGLLYLLLTLIVASIWGREVGLLAAVVSNLCLNFFFVPPVHQFTVQDPKNVAALIIFLLVSIIGGSLLSALREAAAQARHRQAETEVALRLSRAMSGHTEAEDALRALCGAVTEAFAAPGAAVLTGGDGRWTILVHAGSEEAGRLPGPEERSLLDRAAALRGFQGAGQSGFSGRRLPKVVAGRRHQPAPRTRSVALVPLTVGDRVLGVLRLDGPMGDTPFREHPEDLLNAVASEAALAVQRAELAKSAAHAEALREADEMKTALMASISHDLKTPLAGIKAAVSSILDTSVKWSEDDLAAFLHTIDSQADRLDRVISDILDLNRIQSGALTPERAPVRASELLKRARDITLLETRGREVTIEAPSEIVVLTDESLMAQALVNLVENAAKYSTPGKAIHLQAKGVGEQIEITVADEGPGIGPQDLPYVFERFYRAEEHSRRVKGSGLGLTIVKGFVNLCGGTVTVDSSPAGTRFVIRLPAGVAEEARV